MFYISDLVFNLGFILYTECPAQKRLLKMRVGRKIGLDAFKLFWYL
jgi:hypothetical protein